MDLEGCVRLALEANPDYRSRRAALEAARADVAEARAGRYPSLGLTASAARYETAGSETLDRHDVGVGLSQILYRGGRVEASVEAAAHALEADEGTLAAARAALILAVREAWYRAAQGERLVRSAEDGLARSRLNLEYAEAQLEVGMGTRPDVLRARVDVSTAELELTRARNTLDSARALLNILMGQPPDRALTLAPGEVEEDLPPLPSYEKLRARALEAREELRVARARRERQEALLRLARGARLPSLIADAGVSRGATASRSPAGSWSVGVALSLPLFEGFALSADAHAQRALLEAARFDEEAVAQGIEAEVWDALLAEGEAARRLENARSLVTAATENLEAARESYRQGLGTMIALVDARTAFTEAEQTLIQAVFDRRIVRAVLQRVVEGDTFGRDAS